MAEKDPALSPLKKQIFDNPSDRRIILGYLCGLVSAFCLGCGVLTEIGGGTRALVILFYLFGIAFMLPALIWSMFWRIIATLVSLVLGVKYSLDIKDAISHYGMIKTVLDAEAGTEEARYGLLDVLGPIFSTIVCIFFSAFVSYSDLKDARSGRNFRVIFNGVATVALSVVIWAMANYIASRRPTAFDWTKGNLYTLSDESKTILKTAKQPMVMHIFLSKNSDRYAVIKRLADQYKAVLGGQLELRPLDPFEDRVTFEQEAARLEIIGTDLSDLTGVIFEIGHFEEKRQKDGQVKRVWTKDRAKQISIRDMFQVSLKTGSTKPIFKGEELFTNAILEMQGEEKPKIYFLQGHNELAFGDSKTQRACGSVVSFLKTRFFEVLPLRLEGAAGIPKDCAVLVIPGAREPLSASDLSALRAYVKTGGRLLIYDEALMAANDGLKPSPLEDFLLDFNIQTSRHLVFAEFGVQRGDQRMQVQTVNNIPLTAFDVNHPVVKPLSGGRLVSYGARALTVNSKKKDAQAVSLVNSSAKGFVAIKRPRDFKRRNGVIREEDMKSPFSLAAASEMKVEGSKRSRVIVTGDADLMTNQGMSQGKNVEFFLNSLNWLLEKEGRFLSEAKTPPTWSLEIDPGTKIMLQLGALFILPILPLSIGLLMFLLRRR